MEKLKIYCKNCGSTKFINKFCGFYSGELEVIVDNKIKFNIFDDSVDDTSNIYICNHCGTKIINLKGALKRGQFKLD